MGALGLPPVEQSLTVKLATLDAKCKSGKLTREQYREKRKRLQAAFDAGTLTQKELDKYDGELVSCFD